MTALASASVDDLGRELARRVVQRWQVAKDMAERASRSDDLVTIADSAEAAMVAAAQAGDMAIAVAALIGNGDVALVEKVRRQAREAAGSAAYCQARWMRRLRAGGKVVAA